MKIAEYSKAQLQRVLQNKGLFFNTGPFTIHLKTKLKDVINHIHSFYAHFPVHETDEFADFHIRIDYPANLRRWLKPQVHFFLDERVPFKPLPASQASPMLEWGLNWCIANHAHQYLIMHAAALEKNGMGLLMPAEPGSGKSTLTAALMLNGWRLLSDELGIIDLNDGSFVPLSRPVNLKNDSINIIRNYSAEAKISKYYTDTNKGTVALLSPTTISVDNVGKRVIPKLIVQPKFKSGSSTVLEEVTKGQMLMHAAHNSFNYSLLNESGFLALDRLIDKCDCYKFTYSKIDEAIEYFAKLADTIDE